MINIGIVDDKKHLLDTLKESLLAFDEIQVVFEAYDGKMALEQLEKHHQQTDLVLMDIEMDVMDGIEATQIAHEKYPQVKIIMLSVFDMDDKVFEAILAGASGYLLKDERITNIVSQIEDAMEGRLPMSPLIAGKALRFIREGFQLPEDLDTPSDYELTKRELEVLEQISLGLTYQQIAEKLFVSPKTVRKHIENIYRKLQVHSKLDAIQLAQKNKWF